MHLAFIIGILKKNNAIVDSCYGLGYVVVVWVSFILLDPFSLRQLITTILVTIWGARLFFYVTIRNWGKPEDYRYQAMRRRFGDKIISKSYTNIYLFQGLIILIVGFSALFINVSDNPSINWLDFIGIILWIIGFYFEAIGDYQLYKFKKDPQNKGKVMDQGLWKYTQHPNYFGEVVMWWSIYILSVSIPFGFITVFSPVIITFMIIKVSGIRLLNRRFDGDDKYADYRKKTSVFFPWFPKKDK
jgi:steroid 5-alpha reductase family enzyme